MIDTIEISKLIDNRKNMHPNNPSISKVWDELTKLLSAKSADTIAYLNECSEEQVYWLSEVFEDIAYQLKTQEFIDCIESLENKFPKLDLRQDIEFAKKMVD